jgi:hypothetical protein
LNDSRKISYTVAVLIVKSLAAAIVTVNYVLWFQKILNFQKQKKIIVNTFNEKKFICFVAIRRNLSKWPTSTNFLDQRGRALFGPK